MPKKGKDPKEAIKHTASVGSCEVLIKYFRGKINSVECLEKLGEENTKFLSSIAMGELVN